MCKCNWCEEHRTEYIRKIVDDYKGQVNWSENNLDNAIKIFQLLKKAERLNGKELENTKKDLDNLDEDYKELTKNQIYLKHQSVLVNGICHYLNNL